MRIARVFPRKTKATPDDELCFFGFPPEQLPDIDEVRVSVTFSWDKRAAEYLANVWHKTGLPVTVDGPAYDNKDTDFVPGRYLKKGFTVTSRGCNNRCWFCKVWKRYGKLFELPVQDGHIIQDDNLLACSESHIREVFAMLQRQKERPMFTGGLEAKLLKPWHVELFQQVKPKEMFFAYDTPDDYEPLVEAGKLLREAIIYNPGKRNDGKQMFSLASRKVFAYVLVGYPKDTYAKAEERLIDTLKAGFMPFAMLYKDDSGFEDPDWSRFRRSWIRPAAIVASNKEYFRSVEAEHG